MSTEAIDRVDLAKTMLSKVPEVTIYFWIIKVLCTTVGETAADFLNFNRDLGLTVTTIVMSVLLAIALAAGAERCEPPSGSHGPPLRHVGAGRARGRPD
jgi:uncharacterized membrane-anchored protein